MRVEQEQKATEEARILAEKDAAAQRYAVHVIQVVSHFLSLDRLRSFHLWSLALCYTCERVNKKTGEEVILDTKVWWDSS